SPSPVTVARAGFVVWIIVLKLVPAFSDFYGSFHAELPLTTRIIVRGSTLLSRNLPLFVIAIASAAILAYVWVRRPGHRMRLDRILLGLPYVGDVARKFAVSQL